MSSPVLPEDPAFETKPYQQQVQAFIQLLKAKWKFLLVMGVLGFGAGLIYHLIKPVDQFCGRGIQSRGWEFNVGPSRSVWF